MPTVEAPVLDADVDLQLPVHRAEAHPVPVLAAIALGGALGACARYGLGLAWPHHPGQFPWATLLANVSGCLLIGVLMTMIAHRGPGHRLLRPFLGVGVLGGYTTFSTYIADIHRAATAHAAGTALTYLAVTLIGAMLAVWTGTAVTSWLLAHRRPRAGEQR